MSSPFRSPEKWKAALMTLPDNAYFDLMRSIFGNIKTPFNKQRLMDELSAFFSQEDTRKIIAAYINGQDRQVIAAVALLEEPTPGELEHFFAGELSAPELHVLLLNLEERFILYRFRDEGLFRLALNPALEPVLGPLAEDRGILFPSLPLQDQDLGEEKTRGEEVSAGTGFEDRNLAAFLAFVLEEPIFFRGDSNSIRKKILDRGKVFFPRELLSTLTGTLLNLGLLQRKEDELKAMDLRLREFASLSPVERLEYCAAALYLSQEEAGGKDPTHTAENTGRTSLLAANGPDPGLFQSTIFQRNRVKDTATLIHGLLAWLDPTGRYPRTTLKRMADILEQGWNRGTGGWSSQIRPVFDRLLLAMEETGLLASAGDDCWRFVPFQNAAREDKSERPVLVMDTPLSCILYPEIDFADALALARFCSLRETGAAPRFELTRSSVVRGFDQGIDAQAMAGILTRLSGNRVDSNLGWTLKDWEGRYASVSLHEGVVLTLTEDRRYLTETKPLASLIRMVLAPGVYLLSVSESAEAIRALEKAGVDIIARRDWSVTPERSSAGSRRTGMDSGWGSIGFSAYPPMGKPVGKSPVYAVKASGRASPSIAASDVPAHGGSKEAEALKERFRTVLDRMNLPRQERDELVSRIERRLVLQESQLEGAAVRYEKLEARGLDYVGKAALAKQAVISKSLVEVFWTKPGGESAQILGVPSALEKQEGESILVLNSLRLPLGKISRLRRIKQSIFEE